MAVDIAWMQAHSVDWTPRTAEITSRLLAQPVWRKGTV